MGREGRLEVGLVPGLTRVETEFHFRDAVGSAERNTPERLFGTCERLVMARTVNAGEDLDGADVRPTFLLPISQIIAVIDLDLGNPFDVFDPIQARSEERRVGNRC